MKAGLYANTSRYNREGLSTTANWGHFLARLASAGLRAQFDKRVVWEQKEYDFKPNPAAPRWAPLIPSGGCAQ